MTLTEAARNLSRELRGEPWLVTVGVGSDAGRESIFLYVKRKPPGDVPAITRTQVHFPVVVRKSGTFRPHGGHMAA